MSLQIINTPIQSLSCFERIVEVPAKCDYYFLSATQNFTLAIDETYPCNSWSLGEYIFPYHKGTFFCDLAKIATLTLSGDSVVIEDFSFDMSTSTLSSYVSAFNCGVSGLETHKIQSYVTPNGQMFWLDINDGSRFSHIEKDWTNAVCTGAGSNAQVTTFNKFSSITSGTLASNTYKSVGIQNIGSASGIFMGLPVAAGAAESHSLGENTIITNSLSYDATGTIFLISTMT